MVWKADVLLHHSSLGFGKAPGGEAVRDSAAGAWVSLPHRPRGAKPHCSEASQHAARSSSARRKSQSLRQQLQPQGHPATLSSSVLGGRKLPTKYSSCLTTLVAGARSQVTHCWGPGWVGREERSGPWSHLAAAQHAAHPAPGARTPRLEMPGLELHVTQYLSLTLG